MFFFKKHKKMHWQEYLSVFSQCNHHPYKYLALSYFEYSAGISGIAPFWVHT